MDAVNATALTQPKPKSKPLPKYKKFLRELFALLFWGYAIIKIFIFDIDVAIIGRYFPSDAWIINYKFIIILSSLLIYWTITKSTTVIVTLLYVLFYPFIVVFWNIPKMIYKTGEWNVAMAFVNTIFSFFKSLKYNFSIFSLSIIAGFIILKSDSKVLLFASIIVIVGILIVTYINRFIYIFKPSLVYRMQLNLISRFLNFNMKTNCLDKDLSGKPISEMTESQLQKWSNALQMLIINNRICYFLSSKLRKYQKSRINVVFDVFSIMLLIFLTVLAFAFINIALLKAEPNAYQYAGNKPGIFDFFYYSFSALHFNSINEIRAIGFYAKIVLIIEQVFATIIVVIFITLFFSIKNEREFEEIDDTIKSIKEKGDEVSVLIEKDYNMSIENAIKEIEKLKGGFISFIFYMSNNI